FIIVMSNSYLVTGGAGSGPGRGPARGAGRGAAPGGSGRGGGGGRGPGAMSDTPFEHALIEDIIPYIDATFRTLADQPHRGLAGLSMGGMLTHGIMLAHMDKFSNIGMFSGGTVATSEIKDMADFKKKARLVFISYGSREPGASGGQAAVEALKKEG